MNQPLTLVLKVVPDGNGTSSVFGSIGYVLPVEAHPTQSVKQSGSITRINSFFSVIVSVLVFLVYAGPPFDDLPNDH